MLADDKEELVRSVGKVLARAVDHGDAARVLLADEEDDVGELVFCGQDLLPLRVVPPNEFGAFLSVLGKGPMEDQHENAGDAQYLAGVKGELVVAHHGNFQIFHTDYF